MCRSTDPRDRRLRPVDLRRRARARAASSSTRLPICGSRRSSTDITRVDAILFTHSHADHILGLDEVRRFNALQGAAIPCYANREALEAIRRQFSYVFEGTPQEVAVFRS